MLNTIERIITLCLMVVVVGLVLRYYRGAREITEAVGGTLIDVFKVLSLQQGRGGAPYAH